MIWNPSSRDSIVFNEYRWHRHRVVAVLTLTIGVNGALTEPIMMLNCIRLTMYQNQKKDDEKDVCGLPYIQITELISSVLSFVLVNWFHVVLAQ